MCLYLEKLKRNTTKDPNLNDVADNKTLWKTIKPFFGNNVKGENKIALVKKKNLIADDKTLAKTFKTF